MSKFKTGDLVRRIDGGTNGKYGIGDTFVVRVAEAGNTRDPEGLWHNDKCLELVCPGPAISTTADVLAQRGSRYGRFQDNANVTQQLEDILRAQPGWARAGNLQREAAHMILHKLSRAFCGDPDYDDNWVDIAGYGTLVVKALRGEGTWPSIRRP